MECYFNIEDLHVVVLDLHLGIRDLIEIVVDRQESFMRSRFLGVTVFGTNRILEVVLGRFVGCAKRRHAGPMPVSAIGICWVVPSRRRPSIL